MPIFPFSAITLRRHSVPPKLVLRGTLGELKIEGDSVDSTEGRSRPHERAEGALKADTSEALRNQEPSAGVAGNVGNASWQGVTAPHTGNTASIPVPQNASEDTIMGGADDNASFGVQGQPQATVVRG